MRKIQPRPRNARTAIVLALLLALTLPLAGCLAAQEGAAPDDADDSSPFVPEARDRDASRGSTADSSPPPAEPGETPPARDVRHDLGTTRVEGRPTRVVALEWNFIETLLALGIQPTGVADKQGFEEWVDVGIPLDPSVVNVGTRSEPSLEKIAALEPDLILAIKFRHESIYDELSTIAPTLVYDAFPGPDSKYTQFTKMEATVRGVAHAMALDAEGEAALQDLHDHLDAGRADLAAMKLGNREILLTQVFTAQGAAVLRVFTDNSLVVHTAHELGLRNAWPHDYEQYGFSTVSMEALAPVQHADFFYVAQSEDNPVTGQWRKNPVWNSYEFVEEDRVFALGEKTWLFPGPLGIQRLADKIVDNYAAWKGA